jgi:hypothetical protein
VCTAATPGIAPTNPNGIACPTGTTQHGVDLSGTPICTGSGAPPTCWTGSYNVSTDPTIAICVSALPAAKDSADASKSAQTAAESAAAAAKAATTKEAAASGASTASGAASTAATASTNAVKASAGAAAADVAAAKAASDAAKASADAAAAAASKARSIAESMGAGSGILPDGTTECGSPGRPPCKIDETGTPDGLTAMNGAKASIDSAFTDATGKLDTVTSASGKDTSWGWVPLSWVTPGSCHALNLGTLPIINFVINFDICPQLAMASEFLTFIWAIGTIALCLSMVWQTMQGQGN